MAINHNDEKIGKFYQAILHYGEEQRKKIEEEVAAFKQKELDEAEVEVLTEAYHLIQKEMAQMRSGISREMAQREMDGRRALLEKRRGIIGADFFTSGGRTALLYTKTGVCCLNAKVCPQSSCRVPAAWYSHPPSRRGCPLSAANRGSIWSPLYL